MKKIQLELTNVQAQALLEAALYGWQQAQFQRSWTRQKAEAYHRAEDQLRNKTKDL